MDATPVPLVDSVTDGENTRNALEETLMRENGPALGGAVVEYDGNGERGYDGDLLAHCFERRSSQSHWAWLAENEPPGSELAPMLEDYLRRMLTVAQRCPLNQRMMMCNCYSERYNTLRVLHLLEALKL